MKLRKSQPQIYSTVDQILNRGATIINQNIINAKVPCHTSQLISNFNDQIFISAYQQSKQKNRKIKQKQTNICSVDTFAPNRIKIKKKSLSQVGFMPKKVPLWSLKSEKKIEKKSQKNSQSKPIKNNEKIKKGFSIKFLCQRPNEYFLKQEKMRKQIKQRLHNQRQKQKHQKMIEAKKKAKQKQKNQEAKQLRVKGIPFLYNDEGMLIHPDFEKWKQNKQIAQTQIVELSYNTLQLDNVSNVTVSQKKNVVGRKKGFYSPQKYVKKQKLTNQDYNNNEDRQFSSIPFLNLCEGIKLIQKNKDITASKNKQPQSTRQQFVKQNQSTCFKSFMPELSDQISQITLRSMSAFDRPNTTANYNRTKITGNTGLQQSGTRKSLLWRPKTTTKGSRMTINNENLVKDLINQEQ